MTNGQAILLGACVIAASIFCVEGSHAARAGGEGPYQLVHHSNTSAVAGVFRLDVNSGEVSYCYVPNGGQVDVVCSRTSR